MRRTPPHLIAIVRQAAALVATAACLIALGLGSAPAGAAEAEAAQPPLKIKLLLSSRSDQCYDRGDIPAIKTLAAQERDRINAQGGIAGRRLELEFLDDQRDDERAITQVREAVAEPNTLALVGLGYSSRAKAVFDAAGAEIKSSGVPFLSNISITSIFADYPHVFTTRASQDDERVPVLVQFVKQIGAQRPAFVGIKNSLFSDTLANGLKGAASGVPLVADHRLALADSSPDPVEVAADVEDLKLKDPDLLFLTVGTRRSAEIIEALTKAGVTPPLFITGSIDRIPSAVIAAYPNDLYQVTWEDLPDVYNDRLRRLVSRDAPEKWIFDGRKVPEAPGWASGECKPRSEGTAPDVFSGDNIRAIRIGGQYADMVGLVAAAAGSAERAADLSQLRAHVVDRIKTAYAAGRGTYQGRFDNWSFRMATRAAARTPFIVQLVHGKDATQLAPVQFVRLRDGSLRPVNTLYLDIDMIRAFRVDDNEKSFFAEFYLAMHDDGKGTSIDDIDFANAFLDPRTNDRQLNIRVLNQTGTSAAYPDHMKIYHVAGRFMFDPDFANYPFDVQRFSIDIRPKRDDAPFIVQPPPSLLRDRAVVTDNWMPKEQYVGYDEDFVPTTDAKSHEQSIVPFYKASFVWLMARETTDYYLRVVVPLGFILLVAYLSIFIPRGHFEAIVTIQITALLSAVALYLALPQVDADTATLSDRIFLFIYMAVSIMITISIMRVNPMIAHRAWLRGTLGMIHVVGIPALGILMALYIFQSSLMAH
jgi:ABC-type branched-subunit amino acid transport system substrate-binding protein